MAEKEGYIVVLMTCPSELEAQEIAKALVERRKAACVGIFPKGESFFWWAGRIDRAEEFLVIAKSHKNLLDELTQVVKGIHSYDVPEIVALPITGGNPDYLDWLERELRA